MEIKLELLEAIAPEAAETLKTRYRILECVMYNQPVGRRAIAVDCNLTERHARTETDLMTARGFITSNHNGMIITEYGKAVYKSLGDVMHAVFGYSQKEEKLAKALGIKKVTIAKGDIDSGKLSFEAFGKVAAASVEQAITDGDTIAITGGSTLRCVADSFVPQIKHRDIKVVPGRGGIGSNPEIQSNTIASILADKLDAKSDILYLPDMLNPRIARTIMQEPNIKKIMATIKNVDLLIFGIGVSEEMATRRGLSKPIIDMIEQRGAVGEAFGYYFNESGDIVYLSHTIGITLDEMKNIDRIIGIAGGAKKAKAILSVMRNIKNTSLITDESAANELCRLLGIELD